MGVNQAGFGFVYDEVVRAEACQENYPSYFRYGSEYFMGAEVQ
jgi:uncharacterized protein (UPF0371 family)